MLESIVAKKSARVLFVALFVALLASGCKVDATVDVAVNDDGSGVVRVRVLADADAVKAVESGGAPIEQAVRLADLKDAGWVTSPWVHPGDGSARVVLSKRFGNVSEVAGIVREISGTGGPLRVLVAERTGGLLGTSYAVKGTIDLQNVETGVPADAELVSNLSGQSVDVAAIDQQLLAQLKASFGLKVVVRLPNQSPVTVTAPPGKVTPVDVSASVLSTQRVLFLVAALAFGILAAVMWRRGGRRYRRRARPARAAPARRSGPRAPVKRTGPVRRPPGAQPRRPGPPRGSPPPRHQGPPGTPPSGPSGPRPSGPPRGPRGPQGGRP